MRQVGRPGGRAHSPGRPHDGCPLVVGHELGLDAPADPNDIIAGYSILQAQDDDAVRAVLDGHPHTTQWGGTIEVLRMLPLPGM